MIPSFNLIAIAQILIVISCGMESKTQNFKGDNLIPFLNNQDSIILELHRELESSDIKKNFSTLTYRMIETLNASKSKSQLLFPYLSIDSVILYSNEPINAENYTRRTMDRIKKLNRKEFSTLSILLNNPLNYHWAECGTQMEELTLIYYKNGNNVASVVVSCNFQSIECIPENILTRFGGLTKEGINQLNKVICKSSLN